MSFKLGTFELTKGAQGVGYEIIGFDKGSLRVRSAPTDRSFSHGSMDTADGKISGRTVRLIVRLVGWSEESYKKLEDDLLYHVYQEDWKLFPDAQRYINVKRLVSADHSWESNVQFKTMGTWTFSFFCEDPFWYFGSVERVLTIDASPFSFDLYNIGTAQAFPIITIVPSASNPTMSLENQTDDLMFQYVDANFVTSDSLVVDSQLGTVVRNSTNSIKYFTGSFPRLSPGRSEMEYTGALGTMTISWVNGYL